MLDVFLQTGGEASVVVEAGRGLGEVAVAAAGNRLLVTSCPPAKGTMAAALPADTLIQYQGDGALATRFTLDTATGAAASVQTTFQLDPTSAAADVTVLTIDYQGTDQRVRDTAALFGATAPPTPPGPPLWRCAGRGGWFCLCRWVRSESRPLAPARLPGSKSLMPLPPPLAPSQCNAMVRLGAHRRD